MKQVRRMTVKSYGVQAALSRPGSARPGAEPSPADAGLSPAGASPADAGPSSAEPTPAHERDAATAATSLLAAQSGAWAVRVHEVPPTRDALAVWQMTEEARGAR